MYPAVLEGWSRRSSWLHLRDARAKLAVTGVLLVSIATTPTAAAPAMVLYLIWIMAGVLLARLPVAGLLLRACAILPLSLLLALASALGGHWEQAAGLVARSYLSAAAVLLLVGSTPMNRLLAGMAKLGVPRSLVLVVQFLYRYLLVVLEQALRMRLALASRGGGAGWRMALTSGTGAIAVLFSSSYQRAESVHQAMLARGFNGRLPETAQPRFSAADALLVVGGAASAVAIRLMLGVSI